jgi:cation diffusion facilitator CzcD-associated flavoprotein CzcO
VPDPALRARLTPSYPLGCKRIIYSNDYFPALTLPQSELVTSPIHAITAAGVLTEDGREHELDALVCATGFDTARPLAGLRITGLDGLALEDAWRDGQAAYFGISVPGFPNFFLTLGPNTGTGHTSTLLFIEPQVSHALACMQRVRRDEGRWIAVRADVCAAQVEGLQRRLTGSVWSHCSSWYRDGSGRIFAIWPGFTSEYVRAVARPDAAAYELG